MRLPWNILAIAVVSEYVTNEGVSHSLYRVIGTTNTLASDVFQRIRNPFSGALEGFADGLNDECRWAESEPLA